MTQGIGIFCGNGAKLGIVVNLEIYTRIAYRRAVNVDHSNVYLAARSIVADEVYLGKIGSAKHHLLGSGIIAKHLGVHEHGTRSRSIEPSEVKNRLWLAGTEEIPFAIGPSLHPCVVVVGVCPARCVDLTSWNADSTQGGHGERALLTATACGCAHGGKGCRRACVRRLICHLLVAPVVNLKNGIIHALALDPVFQFAVEHGA